MNAIDEFYKTFILSYENGNIEHQTELVFNFLKGIFPLEMEGNNLQLKERIYQHLKVLHQMNILPKSGNELDSMLLEKIKNELLNEEFD